MQAFRTTNILLFCSGFNCFSLYFYFVFSKHRLWHFYYVYSHDLTAQNIMILNVPFGI